MIALGKVNLFDLDELSKQFTVTKHTLRKYINAGKLKGQKVGKRWYVSEESLKEFFGTRAIQLEITTQQGAT